MGSEMCIRDRPTTGQPTVRPAKVPRGLRGFSPPSSGRGATYLAGERVSAFAVKCRECERVFDLTDEQDSTEWHYGHDCEAA